MSGSGGHPVVATIAANVWDIQPGVGFVALAMAVAGVAAMGLLWRSTAPQRVEPGPPSMDLGDETPALVDLLTGGFDVDDDAVPATVIDLAARRYIDIDELGGKVTLRVRRASAPARDELTPYEQRVLTHIEQHTIGDTTPADVLTIGPEGVSERWFKSFTREVNQHGQSLGLCHRRFDFEHLAMAWGIVVVAAGPAWLIANLGGRSDDPSDWGSLGNLLVGLALLTGLALVWLAGTISKSNRQTSTEAGRAAAAHWLGVRDHMRSVGEFDDKPAASVAIWDRHLAYATAMGLARTVQRQLPFETEHDRKAWSRATGEWRRVTVRYQSLVPKWGTSPGKVLFEGLLQGAIVGVVAYGAFLVSSGEVDLSDLTDEQQRWVSFGAFAIGVFAAAVFLYCVLKVVLGVSDLFARRTIEGEVVRARILKRGHRLPRIVQWAMYSGNDEQGMSKERNRRRTHHVAIDQGDDDSIVSHVVRSQIYGQVRQGMIVRAVVTPRLGYVREVEVVAAPRRSAASAPTMRHELIDEATGRAGAAIAGSMQSAMSTLEGATDEDGRPILDQVDEDGVTMRERLRESNDQIAALRDDPRLQNTPIAGFLDAFLGADGSPSRAGDDDDDRSPPHTDAGA
ncbi:MAG: hypothetical protein CL424_08360 [Acidimicrobiaceae bacterium]|nr:hypothetical protein [Acidimicrobiaceae bacterium]